MTKHIFAGWSQTFLSHSINQEAANCPELYGNLSRPALTSSVSTGIHCNEGIFGKLETQEVHSCKIFFLWVDCLTEFKKKKQKTKKVFSASSVVQLTFCPLGHGVEGYILDLLGSLVMDIFGTYYLNNYLKTTRNNKEANK